MRITLPSGSTAELARPSGAVRRGLVISTDIFGLRPLYDEMCARLADEYEAVVVAPDPFPGHDPGPSIEARQALVPLRTDERSCRDLLDAADLAGGGPGDSGALPVSLIGFCLGGMYCHKAAPLGRFHRIVSFYGMIRLPEGWSSDTQEEPLSCLRRGGASTVLAIIGERDHYTPADAVDELAATGVTVVRYPEAEHGFVHDQNRPSHRPADAADAWQRCRTWIDA
jgi:carboxymethylenebutenolidase